VIWQEWPCWHSTFEYKLSWKEFISNLHFCWWSQPYRKIAHPMIYFSGTKAPMIILATRKVSSSSIKHISSKLAASMVNLIFRYTNIPLITIAFRWSTWPKPFPRSIFFRVQLYSPKIRYCTSWPGCKKLSSGTNTQPNQMSTNGSNLWNGFLKVGA